MIVTIERGQVTAVPENSLDLALLIKEINGPDLDPPAYECKQHAQTFNTKAGLAIHKARMH